MNEEFKRDEIIETEAKPEEVVVVSKFSLPKLLIWVALVFSVMLPFVSLGASITALIMTSPEEKEEVYTVSTISIVLAAFFTIMTFIW